jgi:TonB family protein
MTPPPPAAPTAADAAVESLASPKRRTLVPAIALLLFVIAAVWAGSRLFQRHPDSGQVAATSTVAAPPTVIAPAMVTTPPKATATPRITATPKVSAPAAPPRAVSAADASGAVLHEEIPDVPRSARATIRGQINVAVRVTVDSGGTVVDETLEDPGPSKYFARLATAAAKKWRFAPADSQGPRRAWLLRFEFTRSGAEGHAAAPRS